MKDALLSSGWRENTVDKRFFDLKFTIKLRDIDYNALAPWQIINHAVGENALTVKIELLKTVKRMTLAGVDTNRFFPPCYFLNCLKDHRNFTFAFALYKCAQMLNDASCAAPRACFDYARRCLLLPQADADFDAHNEGRALQEMRDEILLSPAKSSPASEQQKSVKAEESEGRQIGGSEGAGQEAAELVGRLEERMGNMGSCRNNLWIVKPSNMSRGRGIRVFSDLEEIETYLFASDCEWVVQKYLENQMMVHNRKFDMRVWAFVPQLRPLSVWVFEEFYLRFAASDYSPDPTRLGPHVTNNSLTKYTPPEKDSPFLGLMWTRSHFYQHLSSRGVPVSKTKEIDAQIDVLIARTLQAAVDGISRRKNSVVILGYDFMLTDDLQVQLIEVNLSPSMEHSTPVTAQLVPAFQHDTARFIAEFLHGKGSPPEERYRGLKRIYQEKLEKGPPLSRKSG